MEIDLADPRYWRIRMKVSGEEYFSEKAWNAGQAGVWYGAWTVDDWRAAIAECPVDPWSILKTQPDQVRLGWNIKPDLGPTRRLEAIAPEDWVVVVFDNTIGFARVEEGMFSEKDNIFNYPCPGEDGQEVFKYRKLKGKKLFHIPDLPDSYRLISTQGRGNVHEFHGMYNHIKILAESFDTAEVLKKLSDLPFDEMIKYLGSASWESLSYAYLTLEHGFVTTGLSTGRTLPTFDIVGRRFSDGTHIFAQCKKNWSKVKIEESFKEAILQHGSACRAFYFAYGGCDGDVPENVEVIGHNEIMAWVKTERGSKYRQFLLGKE